MSNAGIVNINAVLVNPSSGGTGVNNPPANTVAIAEGSQPFHFVGPGSAGQVLQSAGAGIDPAFSTASYPSTAMATGTILRADGTNWSATTATYPATTTANQLIYSSATNTISGLATGNSLLAATNSSGTLAMRSFSVNIQTFTSSGTYTPSTGMLYCIIEVIGGGGGSGGCATTGAGTFAAAGGGGGGGYARGKFSAATIGISQSVTVNNGGTAGTIGNNPGGTGGTVLVGGLISATGGGGGSGSAASAGLINAGGAGGIGGGGDFQITGQPGGLGLALANTNGITLSGAGGISVFAGGGSAVVSGVATAGTSFGSGAGGGSLGSNSTQIVGASGAKGVVIITEYIIN